MCTILLIDGHDDSRRIYGTFLEYHGYRTLEAAELRAGRLLLRECAPDLVVLSAFLPRLDAGAPREWPLPEATAARVPVVLLTAHPLAEGERVLLDGFCAAHLVKPCPPSTLLVEVERLLRRRARS